MQNFIWFILAAVPLIIIGALVVGTYNSMVKLRDDVESSWSYLDFELEKKANLADNLAGVVRKYFRQENSATEDVAEAWPWLMYAEKAPESAEASSNLNRAVEDLFYSVEDYDLSTTKSFEDLSVQFEETEYQIEEYGYFYNEMVYVYNDKLRKFPGNLISSYFGFEVALFFNLKEADDGPGLDSNPDDPDTRRE